MASALSLKEYLKKYENTKEDETKKKKKKKKPTTDTKGGVLVVDEDPVWQKSVHLENSDDDEDSPDEKPQINVDIEVKRMKRLELLRSQRPYHAISEDGSGWVSVSDHAATNSNSTNQMADDISPPRRRPRYDTPSPEPENPTTSGNGAGGEGDLSPPRQKRKRYDSPSPEPSNSIGRDRDRDKDMSPPRRSRSESVRDSRKNDDDDLSPPRRAARVESTDLSPPRRNSRVSATEDLSPPRRSKKVADSADLSPPRRSTRASATEDLSPPRKSKKVVEPRAGLFSAQEIKKEIESKRKEELARYKKLDPSVTGRGAEPVYRDKEGKRISKDEALKLQKGEEKPKEKKLEWGKGLAQKREAEAKEQELELEKDKPFARTRDDPELDKMLKDRVRWGDPMAHLVKSKHSDLILEDLGDDEKMKESGFIIPQDIPSHSWIKRRLDAAPNRYGIKPGRHWDGVDRSNGYEKEYFKRINEKQATEREAYLWSVSDM